MAYTVYKDDKTKHIITLVDAPIKGAYVVNSGGGGAGWHNAPFSLPAGAFAAVVFEAADEPAFEETLGVFVPPLDAGLEKIYLKGFEVTASNEITATYINAGTSSVTVPSNLKARISGIQYANA